MTFPKTRIVRRWEKDLSKYRYFAYFGRTRIQPHMPGYATEENARRALEFYIAGREGTQKDAIS